MLLKYRLKTRHGLFFAYPHTSRRHLSQPKESEALVDLLLNSSRTETNVDAQPKFHQIKHQSLDRSINTVKLNHPTHSIHFPKSESVSPYVKTDVRDLGKLYLTYYFVKYSINHHPGLSFSEYLNLSENYIKNIDRNFQLNELEKNTSSVEYIGQFILQDMEGCHLFLKQFIQKSDKCTTFSSHLDSISPNFKIDKIDYRLIWNSVYKDSKYDFPKLESPESSFNPLVLASNVKDMKFLFIDSKGVDIRECGKSLDVLYKFGRLTHEFHSAFYLLKHYKKSDPHFLKVIKDFNRLMRDIMKYNSVLKVIDSYNVNDNDINRIFYQYVGFLDLESNNTTYSILNSWFSNIINELIKNSDFKFGYISSSESILRFRKSKHLPLVQPLEISDSLKRKLNFNGNYNINVLDEINIFGNDFLNLTLHKFLINSGHTQSNNFEVNLKRYHDIVQNHIEQSFRVRELLPKEFENQLTFTKYIGIFALMDYKSCENFLLSFIDEELPTTYENIINDFKSILFETNLPCLRFNKLTSNATSNPFTLPLLKDYSNITRAMMLNASIIYPKSNNLWMTSSKLKHHLNLVNKLGILNYKVSLKHTLFNKLSDYSIDYYPTIIKLLNSNQFFNYTLDKSGIFLLFKNNNYEKVLIEKRFNKNLLFNQYGQYMGILTINNQLTDWVNNLTKFMIGMIENLDHIEADYFLKQLNQKFFESNFAINEMFKSKQLGYIQKNLDKFKLENLSANHKIDNFLTFIGRQFLLYMVNRIHLNLGLDNFINSKAESMELLDDISDFIFPLSSSAERNTIFQYFASYLLKHGLKRTEKNCEVFIRLALNCRAQELRLVNLKRIDLALPTQSVDKIRGFCAWGASDLMIPTHVDTKLHRLLLINYLISRPFLRNSAKTSSSNLHELPDICTKFNSMGNEFYKFSVIECIYKSNMNFRPEILDRLLSLLFDRKFKSIIAFKNRLYNPFESSDYLNLTKGYIQKEYHFFRFGNQSLNQVIGSFKYHNVDIHSWISNLVSSLLIQLGEKTPEQQPHLIDEYEASIEKEFKQTYLLFREQCPLDR